MADDADPSVGQFFSHHTPAEHPAEESSSSSQEIADLVKSFNDCELRDFFHLDEILEWIKQNSFKRVALQLPDHFLSRSYRIAKFIESNSDAKIFVLADTSYRR
ncbi:hypothetical protein OESDEN_18564 [Oesophagostomum dentatum]|uniref:Uncharacterized protein n=1 Tax=Oesophagostomum dentatum TaxID=61180 RepID=A0A0B1S8Y2_OESDE|nr:hypothetical protein OESDEN_18564 [Oesophagostomum dentatum]